MIIPLKLSWIKHIAAVLKHCSVFFHCAVIGIVNPFGFEIAEQPEGVAHPAAENPGGADGSENQAEPPEFEPPEP